MGAIDWIAIAAYAAAVLAIGGWAAKGASSPKQWLLAGRELPTTLVLLSMVATELSAATFIGVPHAAYTGDWSYLQLAFGALAAKLLLAARVIPAYHRAQVVTVYGYLEGRFGPATRRAAALCFVGGRVLASGARLFIAALAFSAAIDIGLPAAVLGCAVAAGVYTRIGGLRAVVWTDALQALVFASAAGTALALLIGSVEGGLGAALAWATEHGRTEIFHVEPWIAIRSGLPLGSALISGFFLTLATHATDHDMVQRLLGARDGKRGGRALWLSALINFPMTLLFLLVGTLLAYHHAIAPPLYDVSDARQVFPLFALHELPSGVRGLMFAGLFAAGMSSLDSAICAITATWVSDIAPTEAQAGSPQRIALWTCAALAAAALAMGAYQAALADRPGALPNLVEFALSAMSVLYGGLLGVFSVGFLAPGQGTDQSAVTGLALGAGLGLALFLQPLVTGEAWIAWGYRIPITAALTGATVVLAIPRKRAT